ncbi:hypothetical protein C8J95_104293 [Elizabethkingia sp. YR214]|nr:hypothetical protein C8J95_104293 [Elizabethkingia sp. YR214]
MARPWLYTRVFFYIFAKLFYKRNAGSDDVKSYDEKTTILFVNLCDACEGKRAAKTNR